MRRSRNWESDPTQLSRSFRSGARSVRDLPNPSLRRLSLTKEGPGEVSLSACGEGWGGVNPRSISWCIIASHRRKQALHLEWIAGFVVEACCQGFEVGVAAPDFHLFGVAKIELTQAGSGAAPAPFDAPVPMPCGTTPAPAARSLAHRCLHDRHCQDYTALWPRPVVPLLWQAARNIIP